MPGGMAEFGAWAPSPTTCAPRPGAPGDRPRVVGAARPPTPHRLHRFGHLGAEPARGQPPAAVHPSPAATGRPPAHRRGRRGHGHDRRPRREIRRTNRSPTSSSRRTSEGIRPSSSASSTSARRAQPGHCCSTTPTGSAYWALGFLRDVGKHFTVNQMVARSRSKAALARPDQGISYTEFSYMLLQAYDFFRLHEHHGCRLQIGGSDQWGNITTGVELIRKVRRRRPSASPRHWSPGRRHQVRQDRVGHRLARRTADEP